MKAILTGKKLIQSRMGGICYMLFFQANGKSYRTYVSSLNKNYKNWTEVLAKTGKFEIDGLELYDQFTINADSFPAIGKEVEE